MKDVLNISPNAVIQLTGSDLLKLTEQWFKQGMKMTLEKLNRHELSLKDFCRIHNKSYNTIYNKLNDFENFNKGERCGRIDEKYGWLVNELELLDQLNKRKKR